MNIITAYECEHCKRKVYRSKSSAKRHEKKCFQNPDTRSCVTCDEFYINDYLERNCGSGFDLRSSLNTGCPGYVNQQLTTK